MICWAPFLPMISWTIGLLIIPCGVCQVPGMVRRDCVMDFWGYLYIGDKSVTKENRECQHWVTRMPMHKVDPKLKFYQLGGKLQAGSSCRQAMLNGRPMQSGPWCYTVDPKVKFEPCEVEPCPERQAGCVTGMCMEYRGFSNAVLRSFVAPEYGRCKKFSSSAFHKSMNKYSIPKYLRNAWKGACGNPSIEAKQPFGRLTGPWCPILAWPSSGAVGYRWTPCELPLLDDKELTVPVHYTHAEIENRLVVFWRLRSATVRFWLRAWTDYIKGAAVLYLTEFAGEGVAAVEIIIGWLNKETKMCLRANGFVKDRCVVKSTFNIVSAEQWREFWVRGGAVADSGSLCRVSLQLQMRLSYPSAAPLFRTLMNAGPFQSRQS